MTRLTAVLWIQEMRLYAVSASVTPVLIALGMARLLKLPTPARAVASVLATAVLLHLGTNVINDAADYWKGVDRPGTTGGSGLLTAGKLDPRTTYRVGVGLLLAAALVGLPVIVARGWPVIALGVIGALGGYAYTAGPAYKYKGLGDLGVFLLMGPVLVDASFYAITGVHDFSLLLKVTAVSLPVAFLVTAILAVNNYRDLDDDAAAGITTMAHWLGPKGAGRYTRLLFVAALVASVVLLALRALPWTACVALIAFVPAWKIVRDLSGAQAVERTAGVHAIYGGLAFLALLGASWM